MFFEPLEQRTLLAANVWVDDNWYVENDVLPAGLSAGDTVSNWNDITPATITGKKFGTDAFATIQEGINAVDTGGTVNVLAGTYNENVSVSKRLTLHGAGTADTVLTPASGTAIELYSPATVEGFYILQTNSGTAIQLMTAGASGTSVDPGVIRNNKLESPSASRGKGIDFKDYAIEYWDIADNQLINRSLAIYLNQASHLSITRNTLSGYKEGVGMNWSGEANHDLMITNNTFSGTDYPFTAQERLDKAAIMLGVVASNVQITGNVITGSPNGIRVPFKADAVPNLANVQISDNSIYGNVGKAVINDYAAALNCSGNWWGSSVESEVSGLMSGAVDFTPYLDSDTDTSTDPGFQGDYSILHVTTQGSQTGAAGRIQEGVNTVSTGGTVNVAAGSYAEALTINKTLSLSGEHRDTTIINASGFDTAVSIDANSVLVTGLQIRNANRVGISLGNVDGVTIDNNIIKDNNQVSDEIQGQIRAYRVTLHDLTVSNNRIESSVTNHVEQTGIRLNEVAGSNFDILNNQFVGEGSPTAAGARTGMRRGIHLKNPSSNGPSGQMQDILISGNSFVDVHEGIMVDGAKRGTGVQDLTIRGNTFQRHSSNAIICTRDFTNLVIEQNDFGPYAGGVGEGDRPAIVDKLSSSQANVGDKLTVRNNTFDRETTVISLGNSGSTLAGATVVYDNSFTNLGTNLDGSVSGSGLGVKNQTATIIDASGNWWDTVSETAIAAATSPTVVDYTPWLALSTDVDGGARGFAGDFSYLHVGAASPQTGSTGPIQEAIGLLTSPGIVQVHPGTYAGDVDASLKSVTLVPGASPGQVTINGNLTLDGNDTLDIELNGNDPGTGYDQLVVNGTVTVGGASLNLSLGYTPGGGKTFVLIDNDLADAVSGMFAGLANGATLTVGGQNFQIFYNGGDGNDVLLRTEPSAVYVDDNWAGLPVGSDPDGLGGPATAMGYDAFAVIQDGIDAVSTGGTVHVLAGTYPLSTNLSIDKSLTLSGPNAGISPNTGVRVTEALLTGEFVWINDDVNDVVIDGFKLEITTATGLYTAISIGDSTVDGGTNERVTVANNWFTGGNCTAVKTSLNAEAIDLSVTDNRITSLGGSLMSGLTIMGVVDGEVSRNVIDGTPYAGILLEDVVDVVVSNNTIANVPQQGIQLADLNGTVSNVTIADNTITNANTSLGADRGGIRLYGSNFAGTVNVTGNTISGSYQGIAIKNGQNIDGKDIHITDNNLAGNAHLAIYHGGTGVLDASGNWFGSNVEAAVSASVSGPVDFTPYLDSDSDTSTDPGFQGDYSILHVTTLGSQSGGAGRIQEAVDLIADGSLTGGARTVNVAAGTYDLASALLIDIALTVQGAGRDTTIVRRTGSPTGTQDYTVGVQAPDVTFKDLAFTGWANAPSLTTYGDGYLVWNTADSATYDNVKFAGDNIRVGIYIGTSNNVTITNSLFTGSFYRYGIRGAGEHMTFTHNVFQTSHYEGGPIYMEYGAPTSGTISDNLFEHTAGVTFIDPAEGNFKSDGTTLNTITNWQPNRITADGLYIQNNTFHFMNSGTVQSKTGAYPLAQAIYNDPLVAATGPVSIENNIFTGYDYQGTLSGNPAGPQWQPSSGMYGGALRFDGTGNFASFVMPSDIGSQGTLSLWVKLDSDATGRRNQILEGPGNGGMEFQYGQDNGDRFYGTPNPANNNYAIMANGAAEVAVNWTNLQYTWDFAAKYMKVYVNGVEVSYKEGFTSSMAAKWLTALNTAGGLFYLGRDPGDNARYLKGMLDDVAIFDAVLSDAERDAVRTHSASIDTTDLPSLAAYWNLDNASGTTAAGDGGTSVTLQLQEPLGPAWRPGAGPDGGGALDLHFYDSTSYATFLMPQDIGAQGTFSVWVKLDDTSKRNTLFEGPGDGVMEVQYRVKSGNGQFYARPNLDEGGYSIQSGPVQSIAANWTNVQCTWDLASQEVRLYVNGTEVTYLPDSGPVLSNWTTAANTLNGLFYLGMDASSSADSVARFFDGLMDDPAFFNSVLSPSDLDAVRGQSTPINTATFPSLVAYWNLDNTSGNSAAGNGGTSATLEFSTTGSSSLPLPQPYVISIQSTGTPAIIRNNKFEIAAGTVALNSVGQVDAEFNYWSTVGDAGISTAVPHMTNVDVSPYYYTPTNTVDTLLHPYGFQGDTSALAVTTLGADVAGGQRIQEAIDAAASGGTIKINPGTYAENATVDKNLTLVGLSGVSADVVIAPAGGDAVTTTGAAGTVTLQDLTITGAANGLVATGQTTLNLTNLLIDGNTSGGSISNVTTLNLTPTTGSVADTVDINTPAIGGDQHFRAGTTQDVVSFTSVANFNVSTGDEDDTVNVAPDPTPGAVITLDGGNPTSGTPGDTLNYYSDGVNAFNFGAAVITTENHEDINYSGFETTNVSGDILMNGSLYDDRLTINATGPASGTFQLIRDPGGPNEDIGPVVSFVDITSFKFNGLAGDDQFIINNPAGGLFAPLNGITFNGGADSDELQVLGGSGSSGGYTVGPASDAGTLTATNGSATQSISFSFTGPKPILHTATLGTFDINASTSEDTINVIDGPVGVPQTLEVDFDDAYEKIQLANKGTVAVNASGGADVINVNYTVASAGLSTLIINGGTGSDILDISAYATARNVTLSGVGSSDGYTGNQIALVGPFAFSNIDAIIAPAAGGDTLTGANRHTTWSVTGANNGTVSDGILPELTGTMPDLPATGKNASFSSFESLLGGSQNDWFDLSNGAGVSGQIDGGAGNDTLDYRDYSTPVTVDLTVTNAATNLGSLAGGTGGDVGSSIENVFGGSADDALTGDADNNVLGDGLGSDTLTGGAGDDRFVLTPGDASVDVVNETVGSGVGYVNDTLDFSQASAGVTIDMDLLAAAQNVFDGNTVQLNRAAPAPAPSQFENFIGSQSADTVSIDPLAILRTVEGNNPTTGTGDLLNFDAGGSVVTDNGTSLTAGGIGTVLYSEIESINQYYASARTIDDGDVGWGLEGSWTLVSGQGYQSDLHSRSGGSSADVASWTFDGVTPGDYVVSITWTEGTDRASNATLTIKDGTTVIDTALLDERSAPASFLDGGVLWQDLPGLWSVSGHSLTVELTGAGDGLVVADAVRIERVNTGQAEIRVIEQGTRQLITNATGSFDFGSTPQGTSVAKTFEVQNLGTAALTLGAVTVPAGFSSSFAGATVAGGSSATFDVTLEASAVGTYSGRLSFASDDPDENPFDFGVSGLVSTPTLPPAATIGDNDDPATGDFLGFSVVSGTWPLTSPDVLPYFGSDHRYAAPGTGAVAQWQFTVEAGAYYRVSATWLADPNRSANAPFTLNSGGSDTVVAINQKLAPASFANAFQDKDGDDNYYYFADLATPYQAIGTTLTVSLANVSTGYVIADAIRVEKITTPEISVFDGSNELADSTSLVDFGATDIGVPVVKTFTVKNVGAVALTLTEPISLPLGFSLVSSFGSLTLAPNASTTFQVQMDATAPGALSGTLSFGSNDGDENPFDFALAGTVGTSIINDGDPSPSFQIVAGSFPRGTTDSRYFRSDHHYAPGGTGTSVAQWTFTGLVEGATYQVAATWFAYSNRATNAPYTVIVNGAYTTVVVNQRLAPDDFSDEGALWEKLGSFTVPVGTTTLAVQLSNNANGYVIADGVRLQQVYLPTIEMTSGGATVTNGQSTVDFGTAILGAPVTKTFTVTNRGTLPLTLGQPIIVQSGAQYVASSFGQTTLAPRQSTSFTVTFLATTLGTYNGTVSFATNDPVANPFTFSITGTAAAQRVIDNNTAGYAVGSGTWVSRSGDARYYRGTHSYAAPGASTRYVTYTFNDVQPGTYQVSATWFEYSNRATHVGYTLTAGANSTTVYVNQQQAPGDFDYDGVDWRILSGAGFEVPTGASTLTVRLSADPTGYVIADGVQIQYLSPLQAAGGAGTGAGGQQLTTEALTPVVAEAIARWEATGLTAQQLGVLQQTRFVVGNLGGGTLGLAAPASGLIYLDDDGAGYGWFVDPTLAQDEEFAATLGANARLATSDSPAFGRMDLLTTVLHEMGHVLGRGDLEANAEDVMAGSLVSGMRRTLSTTAAKASDALFADFDNWSSLPSKAHAYGHQAEETPWWLRYGQQ